MSKPDFLGIGAIKAGTTWVADALAAHPEVFMAHGKELHYFSQQHQRGEQWYLNHFPDGGEHRAVGEFSVTYMDRSEQTARRIHAFNPDFRLIVAVRDPVERAFSQYRWMKQMGADLPTFEQALARHPDLVSNGCYAANLEPYWRLFPDEQFFYVTQREITTSPEQLCQRLYEFLGVDPVFEAASPRQVVGETIQPRSRLLESLRIQIHHAAMRYGAGYLITLYRRLGLSGLYRRINNDEAMKESLTEQQRAGLAPLFLQDLLRFQQRTGIVVVDW